MELAGSYFYGAKLFAGYCWLLADIINEFPVLLKVLFGIGAWAWDALLGAPKFILLNPVLPVGFTIAGPLLEGAAAALPVEPKRPELATEGAYPVFACPVLDEPKSPLGWAGAALTPVVEASG